MYYVLVVDICVYNMNYACIFIAQHIREIFGRMGFNDQEIVRN